MTLESTELFYHVYSWDVCVCFSTCLQGLIKMGTSVSPKLSSWQKWWNRRDREYIFVLGGNYVSMKNENEKSKDSICTRKS